MAHISSDEISLTTVLQQLRVPELTYQNSTEVEDHSIVESYVANMHCHASSDSSQSIVKHIKDTLVGTALNPRFLNSAFISDRLFDVWVRKSEMDAELASIISSWRFAFMSKLYRDSVSSPLWSRFFDSINQFTREWNGQNQRSRSVALDLFTELKLAIFSASPLDDDVLETIHNRWHTHNTQNINRRSKVVNRLIENERRIAQSRYAEAKAVSMVNTSFFNAQVSVAFEHFIKLYWKVLLTRIFVDPIDNSDEEDVIKINKKMVAVFHKKGDYAFKYGAGLLEEISDFIEKYKIEVDETSWNRLESDIMRLLQSQELDEVAATFLAPAEDMGVLKEYAPAFEVEDVFKDKEGNRFSVVAIFEDVNQVLTANELGIKHSLFSVFELNQLIESHQVVRLDLVKFSDVLEQVVSGLGRILNNQIKSREKAAEKARHEAERLLKEKEEADRLAREKAEEIAKMTQSLKERQSEQKIMREQQKALDAINQLQLGGWITRETSEGPIRFKLAVKFAATNKFIFVDRHGLRKQEIKLEQLIEEVALNKVEILNDGADFDASLERVVSRLRISK